VLQEKSKKPKDPVSSGFRFLYPENSNNTSPNLRIEAVLFELLYLLGPIFWASRRLVAALLLDLS
jgi:hypothetical protein